MPALERGRDPICYPCVQAKILTQEAHSARPHFTKCGFRKAAKAVVKKRHELLPQNTATGLSDCFVSCRASRPASTCLTAMASGHLAFPCEGSGFHGGASKERERERECLESLSRCASIGWLMGTCWESFTARHLEVRSCNPLTYWRATMPSSFMTAFSCTVHIT